MSKTTSPNLPAPLNPLDAVHLPKDLRDKTHEELSEIADALRAEVIGAVSKTGGHLGSSLGVVELTVALHAVFETPLDKLIFDVGHQCYPHKILTGRRDKMDTLRQENGLSGFTKMSESLYDPFGAAHAATSISAALGYAKARDLRGENHNVIAVIGDGSMSAGMAYEAMNNAGADETRLIVILNDNDMSIAPPVGAMSHYFSKLVSSRSYRGLRKLAKSVAKPLGIEIPAKKAEEYLRGFAMGGTLFEEMGFYYIGPIDGHDIPTLLTILQNAKAMERGPILVHAVTQKGKGYEPAEASADKYHGVSKFSVGTGKQDKSVPKAPTYTNVFGQTLAKLAEDDDKICAITAAMPSGTGVSIFAEAFPERSFDVGIAEQHAVTFAAGLAADGMRPFAAIYSTFLQRAYDQVVHDVAIQKLPVRFAIDRAGLVGNDGATHAGSFDIGYLGALPNMVCMAAADEVELARMVTTAQMIDDTPSAFRYPRGEAMGVIMPEIIKPLEVGKGRILQEGNSIAILSYGGRLVEVQKAAEVLAQKGLSVTIADARFAKPLDTGMIDQLIRHHEAIITLEEGSIGGFGSFVMHYLTQSGKFDAGIKIRNMVLPDVFQDQALPYQMYEEAALNAVHIADIAMNLLGKSNVDFYNLAK